MNPLMRSAERVFILCGIADEPTCPGWKPSVTSSLPAISRIVLASDDGAAASWTSADTTSKSSERGYTCPTLVSVRAKPRWAATRRSSVSELAARRRRAGRACPATCRPDP